MPDFTKLATAIAGTAKRPKALPVSRADDYPGIIKSYEFVEAPQGRDYQNIVRLHVGLTGWPDNGLDEDEKMEEVSDGVLRPIDLSKKQLRRDFYDNSLYRLDEFLTSCGIELGRPYPEVLAETVGQSVMVEVQQYLNQRTNEVGNQIGRLLGTAGA